MSQPQNLGADDLRHPTLKSTTAPARSETIASAQDKSAASAQDEATTPLAQHTSATTSAQDRRTTSSAYGASAPTSTYGESAQERVVLAAVTETTSALDSTEAPMAVTNAAATDQLGTNAIAAVIGAARDEVPGMFAGGARPRLQAVDGGTAKSAVPATARYAGGLTEGALALRLQAITRLGVGSSPRHLSSIAADAQATPAQSADTQAADATAADAEAADAAGAGNVRSLGVVPGAAAVGAAPGQPDGARAPLTTTTSRAGSVDTATSRAGSVDTATSRGGSGDAATARASGLAVAAAKPGIASVAAAKPAASVAAGNAVGVGVGLPEVRAWGGRLAQAVSEVLAGDRPISQLVRFTDDSVFLELNRRVRLLGLNSTAVSRGAREKSQVRSVRVFMPEPQIAEVAAHVRHGDRSRALAFRLEIRRNRWVCTALEIG
ncbi:Rv3235 family protein [Kribbella sp. NPDC004875]|uniref:Rv3235 family protein n=1 Tax=Kribbella sp. NPDC004875 TaxID=3364107 RepID=UPI0036CA0725